MIDSLKLLLADARFPSGDRAPSGGMEEACAARLVTDLTTLRSFLAGRLWTVGAVGAVAAAAVCARARTTSALGNLFITVEAELDARIHSPAARQASRDQGGETLRLALTIADHPVLDALARATVAHRQRPHHPTALGAVAAAAGATPEEAARAAAYSSVTGATFAASKLLGLDAEQVSGLGLEMAPEVARLAREAALTSMRPLNQMPAFAAPVLEYLAEAYAARPRRSFAS